MLGDIGQRAAHGAHQGGGDRRAHRDRVALDADRGVETGHPRGDGPERVGETLRLGQGDGGEIADDAAHLVEPVAGGGGRGDHVLVRLLGPVLPRLLSRLQQQVDARKALADGVVDLPGEPGAFGEGTETALLVGEVVLRVDEPFEEQLAGPRFAVQGTEGEQRGQADRDRPGDQGRVGGIGDPPPRDGDHRRHRRRRGHRGGVRQHLEYGEENRDRAPGEGGCGDGQRSPDEDHDEHPHGRPPAADPQRTQGIGDREERGAEEDQASVDAHAVTVEIADRAGDQQDQQDDEESAVEEPDRREDAAQAVAITRGLGHGRTSVGRVAVHGIIRSATGSPPIARRTGSGNLGGWWCSQARPLQEFP